MKRNTKIALAAGGGAVGLIALYFYLTQQGQGEGGGVEGGAGGYGGNLVDTLAKTYADVVNETKKIADTSAGGSAIAKILSGENIVPPGEESLYAALSTQIRSTPQSFADLTTAFYGKKGSGADIVSEFLTPREASLLDYMSRGGLMVAPTGTEGVTSGYVVTPGNVRTETSVFGMPIGYGGGIAYCAKKGDPTCAIGEGAAGNVAGTAVNVEYLGTGVFANVSEYAAALNPKKTVTSGADTYAYITGRTSQGIIETGAGDVYGAGNIVSKKAGTAFQCSHWEGLEFGGTPHRVLAPC
jgi:hypothetical protein